MRPASTDAGANVNARSSGAEVGVTVSVHNNGVGPMMDRGSAHKTVQLGAVACTSDSTKRTGAVTAMNIFGIQGTCTTSNAVGRTGGGGGGGRVTSSTQQRPNTGAGGTVGAYNISGRLANNQAREAEERLGAASLPLKPLRQQRPAEGVAEELTPLESPTGACCSVTTNIDKSNSNYRRTTMRNLPMIEMSPQPPTSQSRGYEGGGSRRGVKASCHFVKLSTSLKSLSPNKTPPSTRMLPDVCSTQLFPSRQQPRQQPPRTVGVSSSMHLEPVWKERGRGKEEEHCGCATGTRGTQSRNREKCAHLITCGPMSEGLEGGTHNAPAAANGLGGATRNEDAKLAEVREDPSLVLAESCALMWESIVGGAVNGASFTGVFESGDYRRAYNFVHGVSTVCESSWSEARESSPIVRWEVDLATWAATPLLWVNGGSRASMKSAVVAHQWCEEQHAAAEHVTCAELGGELKRLDYRAHNVVAQIVHPKRPLQPSYPSRMPLVMEKVHGRRRAVSPLHFYGPKGVVIGPRWFESALDEAKRVVSPNLELLEAQEASRALGSKRS